ncbi:small secreted protein [Streptomyces sp. NRRL B-1677]|uniref:Small secreted protein n=1 Tax=Streptomyces klenkii TaxID=1420899 RepID=A0A3B0BRJ1_9ACTN|nr:MULTISPECIES: small secreted protein [Streptomyces]MBF6046454.1 small secreted protein [Streptomyces sp. NRRL B-1677]RKN74657.1 small secreted protein [Streptomyces klenkii]
MNKKLAAVLSGGTALLLALTGCSSDDEGNKKLDDWAKKVCDQMQPQVKKILEANQSIASVQTEEDSKKVQQTDSAAFQVSVDAYKSLANAVQDAGAPPVKDGESSQKNAVKALNDLSTAYANLKKRSDSLDTGDKNKFGEGLRSIGGDVAKLSGQSSEALKKLQAGDVGKAMAKQPGCQKNSLSPTPSKG